MSIVEDGTGQGYSQKVDQNNRAHTRAVTATEHHDANEEGAAWNLNTGIVSFTTANDSGAFYVKNTSTTDMHVTSVIIGCGASTGGTGDGPTLTFIRNPTAGTLISGATDVSIKSNRNFGSGNTLSADVYKGDGTALTVTDGTDHITAYTSTSSRTVLELDEIIPPGKSMAIKIQPQTSNTAMNVYIAVTVYMREVGL